MSIIINSFVGLIGIAGLYWGGDFFISGASSLAKRFNISPLIIGLTVVAMGTSAPEFFVSGIAALSGHPTLSLGNVIGSNIANILLILGIVSIFHIISGNRQLIVFDFPWLFFSYILLLIGVIIFASAKASVLNIWLGLPMFCSLIIYLYILYRKAKKEGEAVLQERLEIDAVDDTSQKSIPIIFVLIVFGFSMLLAGSNMLINSAIWFAREVFNVSERFISLTVIAFGTSLPELVTSVVAAAKKESDISIGNIVGSNIFNTLGVAGFSAILAPLPVVFPAFWIDFAVMLGASVLLFLFLFLFKRVSIKAGFLFIILYVLYIAYLYNTRII
ncbi:calcium/sodium antiporter [Spirochaetia bacterium 38H-sp]|uniref:Calcium/sodium antiporter n=1 Tax=Rarispira pelagica TaxID=3141764 RepID=A0ABU9UC63_9SPIR